LDWNISSSSSLHEVTGKHLCLLSLSLLPTVYLIFYVAPSTLHRTFCEKKVGRRNEKNDRISAEGWRTSKKTVDMSCQEITQFKKINTPNQVFLKIQILFQCSQRA
jgi:hypothetical protein